MRSFAPLLSLLLGACAAESVPTAGPAAQSLASLLDEVTADQPGIMIGRRASDAIEDGPAGLVAEVGVDQLGQPLDVSRFTPVAATRSTADRLAGTDLSEKTMAEILSQCPHSGFADVPLPNGSSLDLYLPTMAVFRKESLRDLTPDGIDGIDLDQDGVLETGIHVYRGTLLLCDDLATDTVFLGKPATGGTLRPYEPDLSFLCLQLDHRWICDPGILGEGVFGFALRHVATHPERVSPGARPTFHAWVSWGQAQWDAQWLFDYSFAPIVARSPDPGLYEDERTVGASWWNVNPNDHDGTPEGRLRQARRFLAAVAVKSTTNRKGLKVDLFVDRDDRLGTRRPPPTALPRQPCDLFDPCATGTTSGSARDCGWAPDEVYSCNPGDPVSVAAGAALLRVCEGRQGCVHDSPARLGERVGGTLDFPCPSSGVFGVMKAPSDRDPSAGVPWDAPGGGVPGAIVVHVTPGAALPSVLDPCPTPEVGETSECGWNAHGPYECTPGTVVTVSAGSDTLLRVCDGERPCVFTSPRRLAHGSDGSARLLCGASGRFLVLGTTRGALAIEPPPQTSDLSNPDLGSRGLLTNDYLIDLEVPSAESPRACDFARSWGLQPVDLGADDGPWLATARYDRTSTWTRCPSHDPRPDGGPLGGSVIVTVVAPPDHDAWLVPSGGVSFREVTGLDDEVDVVTYTAGTEPCLDLPCCHARPGERTMCRYTAVGGLSFVAKHDPQGPAVPVGFSDAAPGSRTTLVTNHDWTFTADFRTDVCGNYACEPDETSSDCPVDCPAAPSDCADCRPPPFPSLDAPFSDVPPDLLPPPAPSGRVPDETPPVLTVPERVVAVAKSSRGAIIVLGAEASDETDGRIPVRCVPPEGSTVPPGRHDAVCTAVDQAGHASSATFPIHVVDVRIGVDGDVVAPATGPDGAFVDFVAARRTFVDDAILACSADPLPGEGDPVDGALCDPPSGSLFPIGATPVTCAIENAGLTVSGRFSVIVEDDTPPTIAVSDVDATATSAQGAVVTFSPVTHDDVGVVAIACTPPSGSTFPLGATPVTCAALDAAGNRAEATFVVHVSYAWSGILPPINADGSSVFRLGRTVAVKFTLTGASAGIADAVARLTVQRISDAVTGTELEADAAASADSGGLFRFADGTYIYNLPTKGFARGTWRLRIDLGDGVTRTVDVSLTR